MKSQLFKGRKAPSSCNVYIKSHITPFKISHYLQALSHIIWKNESSEVSNEL